MQTLMIAGRAGGRMTLLEAMQEDAKSCNARMVKDQRLDVEMSEGPNQTRASKRRAKVAEMMAKGIPLKRISEVLRASYHTIKSDAREIRHRAGMPN